MAGQQFEYAFDDIGNRLTAASGGDTNGANLRSQSYSANTLNQYTQRTVPPYVDVQGSAHSNATVTVNLQSTYRKGEYFRAELSADNSSSPLWFGITNIAVLTNGGGPDIVTTNEGNVLVAKATETFLHDLDGNQTSDSLWTNSWNAENRLITTESASGVPSGGKAKETWTYLPDGRWIERVIYSWNGSAYLAQTTNRFVWDAQVLLAIIDHTNGLVSSFVRGVDLSGSLQGAGGVGGLLAVNIASNGVHFTAFDGNGNVSALVGATDGAVTANYEFDPFGNTLRADGVVAKANPLRFSTQLADEATGRKKYLHRDLTDTGRWQSRDPLGEVAFLSFNSQGKPKSQVERLRSMALKAAYGFIDNDPLGSVDVLGLEQNCYMHATGLPHSEPGFAGHKRDPRSFQRCFPPYTCKKLKDAAMADGLKELQPEDAGKCKPGWTKVAYFEGDKKGVPGYEPDDHHWAKEEPDGKWSHKSGNEPVSKVDASGNEITDPASANWDFPKIKNKFCDYLCAPPQPKSSK